MPEHTFKPTGYAEVDSLVKKVISYKISFTCDPSEQEYERFFWKRVQMNAGNRSIKVPVYDEWGDLERGQPVPLLNHVMQAIADFEEADDFLVWARDEGLDPADPIVRNLWFELRDVAPAIRDFLGVDLKPVSSFDLELNMGAAQALRKVKIEST